MREATDGRGVNVVLDHVGTPVFAAAIRSLAPEGRFVTCGVTAGHMGELHLGQLFVKGITLMGVGRPDNQRIAATMRGFAGNDRPGSGNAGDRRNVRPRRRSQMPTS